VPPFIPALWILSFSNQLGQSRLLVVTLESALIELRCAADNRCNVMRAL
jgi:hypothetical protein